MPLRDIGKWAAGAVGVVLVAQVGRLVPRDASSDVGEDRVVSRSIESSSEIEPHLAATQGGDLAVVWMAERGGKDGIYGSSFIGARVSHDRAQSWEPIKILRSPDGKLAADPTVAFRRGTPVVTWLGFRRAGGRMHEHDIYSATVGGEPVRVSPNDPPDTVYDRPYSAIAGDRMYVVYGREQGGKKSIALATSDDGRAFQSTPLADNGSMPTVCASGESVVVAFFDKSMGGVTVAQSSDQGKTFTRYFASSGRDHVGAEAPSCVVDGSDVWIAYGADDSIPPDDETKSPAMDFVVVLRSRDGGKTTLDRATVRPGAKMMHPALALRLSGGLDLAYLSGSQEGDARGRVGVAHVTSSGATKPARTAREPVVFATKHDDPAWGGDYLGLAATQQVSFAAVVDTTVEVNDAGKGGVERHVAVVPVPED